MKTTAHSPRSWAQDAAGETTLPASRLHEARVGLSHGGGGTGCDHGMPSVYTASKSRHWPFWQALRAAGLDIVASWIDAPFNHTDDDLDPDGWRFHWDTCAREAASADITLLFAQNGENQMGALIEAGCCLGAGKELWVVTAHDWSFLHHPRCRRFATLADAVSALLAA
jgi:hypothetical protein